MDVRRKLLHKGHQKIRLRTGVIFFEWTAGVRLLWHGSGGRERGGVQSERGKLLCVTSAQHRPQLSMPNPPTLHAGYYRRAQLLRWASIGCEIELLAAVNSGGDAIR